VINLEKDDLRAVIHEASLAPSVHNVQPSRWQHKDGSIELLGDRSRSVPVADPTWRDWRLSHGAALEGLEIALARRGLGLRLELLPEPEAAMAAAALQPIARATLTSGRARSVDEPVAERVSWRGAFRPIDAQTEASLDLLMAANDSLHLIREQTEIESAAALADRAGLHFLRDAEHRRELLQWLRLSRRHPDYARDGLNAEAMGLGAIEAWDAGLVLGPLFSALDAIGVAGALTSESSKTRSAAAVALLHRPIGEDAFVSGRHFYRAWLAIERAGLKGSSMSVLADWPFARELLHRRHRLGGERHIVGVFRLGRPDGTPSVVRARLPVDELIV